MTTSTTHRPLRTDMETIRARARAHMTRGTVVGDEAHVSDIRFAGDTDPTTRAMLERIVDREEEHADDMADQLTDGRIEAIAR